jgi:hypothetical protein
VSQFAGAPGVIGSESVGVASGGGTYSDVAGPLAPSYSAAGQDPEHPAPAMKLPEQSGGTSWSDVFKTLAAGAGQLAITKLLGSPVQRENREVSVGSKGNLGSAPEVLPRYDSTPKNPAGASNDKSIGSTGAILIAGGVLIAVALVFVIKK